MSVRPGDNGPGTPDDPSAALRAAQEDGDEDAFRVLYRAVQPNLLRYLSVLVGDDAEDVASEAWLHIARDLATFRGDLDGFRGWAATIARNRALDHLRHQRRRPVSSEQDEQLAEVPAREDTAESAVNAIGTDEALALIATLPRDQAEAVLLRVVMGLDAAAAARVLGKRAGAVRTAAHRGLRKLADLVDTEPEIRRSTSGDTNEAADAEGGEMSTHRRHLDRRTAEQMLNGALVTSGDPLTDLLAHAAAPARDGELAGEHAAVMAFRAARLETALVPRRPSMLKALLAKLITAKIAAVAAALTVVAGGVVAAAATGYLPSPLGGDSTVAPVRSSAPTSSARPSSADAGDRDNHDAPGSSGSPSPYPSLTGLCDAYTAGAGSEHGKALDSPAFGALITAAGGKDKVDGYCATLLPHRPGQGGVTVTTARPPGADEGHGHSGNGSPTSHPGPNTNHRSGPPTTHPSH